MTQRCVKYSSSMWCRMAQHNSRSSITSCGTAQQEIVRQYIKRFSQPRNSWQSRVMAECDMNQQSVTLAYVRRNHQKYKMRMEQPKVKWNSNLLGAWRHNFWQLPSESMTSRLIWREFRSEAKMTLRQNLFLLSLLDHIPITFLYFLPSMILY